MRYAFFFPLALIVGCASTEQPTSEAPAVTQAAPIIKRAFDVPSLLGMNANQIARPLVNQAIRPDHDTLPAGTTEASYTYWRDSTGLVVNYDPKTLRVNNFVVTPRSGHTSNYEALLKLAGVSKYDKRMTVEPISDAANPKLYSGVRVIPQLQPQP